MVRVGIVIGAFLCPGRGTLARPARPARPCKHPRCPARTTDPSGYCEDHRHEAPEITKSLNGRPSSTRRGYGREWSRIRHRVLLQHGIPESQHHLYDVDHRPRYDASIEPDHSKYQLVPMLRADHSRKTIHVDGGFGNRRLGEGRGKSLGGSQRKPPPLSFTHTGRSQVRGVQGGGG
jgi:hypothetical protein